MFVQRPVLRSTMKGSLLLHLLFQGVLLYDALAWEVKMPKDIHGLKGSCLVIPCSYYYSSNPPQNPASPQQPSIKIYGGVWTGDTITVVCSTLHTCPYSKPNITLNNIEGSDEMDNEHIEDGLWKITLTRTSVTNAENATIECSVIYYGGITVTAMKSINAQSPDHEEADVPVPNKTDWLYILVPSLVCILTCILAGFIHKFRHRQTPEDDMQGSEQKVEASLVREKVTLSIGGPELSEGPQRSIKSALAVSTEKLFLTTAILSGQDCLLTLQTSEYCTEDLENPATPRSAGDEGDSLEQKRFIVAE
ncbi:uncharacterized protein LOC113055808 isoform X2 [Carassius auratus]|uniref:Uncharacterized protein LOC113055808 isoform X2 n=1 Tax=Carassius auratus TaxID=7957 RepID=A0A6P6L0A1_CARAU|nr:uncharacterized protein LOC113055808 isoform X2 [Carassius auratus]